MAKSQSPFQEISTEGALKQLKADQKNGLSNDDVENRLREYGENALEEKKKSIWLQLFSYFWGPIPWMIEVAVILSGVLERWPDFIMILALLLINAALGFIQEMKAENAIQALKERLALRARVLRDGKWQDIEAKHLVPGDIALIRLGNIIPADIKLLSGEYLSVDQSSLTGESLPVDREVGDVVFSGTIAKLGEMVGVVTATGMNTFFGKTAKLVETAKTESHFQKAIKKIGNFLIFSTLFIAAIILVVSVYRVEKHIVHETLSSVAVFILVIVIAGIPVALPAVLSVTMAIGASKMAKFKAILSKLIAIEELAGMNILCSDKTGTLTKNQLTVGKIHSYNNSTPEESLLIATLAANLETRDAIDDAIYTRFDQKDELANYKVDKFIPFDPVRKRTESYVTLPDGSKITASKGAPQIILAMTDPDEAFAKEVNEEVDAFAKRGFRTLGVAKGDGTKWTFLGLIPLFDPPREDTKMTIEHCHNYGVEIKMVTGDHTAISKEIAHNLGLGTNIVSVDEIKDLDEGKKMELLEKADGYAEVFPEHKFDIVKAFQANHQIVGMTGDGVNDAPALKQADIGIAVSNATDAARAAADLILTKPGLLVISKAIEEARRTFGRMKSYATYRISETCRLLLFLLLSLLVFNTHPLTAIMIILIALLNDIPIMMIAYDHMQVSKKPVKWDMKEILTISIGLAIVGVISTFGLYWIGDRVWHLSVAECRTLAFMAILCGGNLTIYLTRNIGYVFSKPLPEWKFLTATLFSQVVGTLASVYGLFTQDFVGIGWKYVGYSWIYIFVWFILCMLTKEALYKWVLFRKDFSDRITS